MEYVYHKKDDSMHMVAFCDGCIESLLSTFGSLLPYLS